MPQSQPQSDISLSHHIIGIAGGSGSGKTALVQAVTAILPGSITVFPLDWYYRDFSHVSPTERARMNFDHPNALEMELYTHHLRCLAAGESVPAPRYDFVTHTRTHTHTLYSGNWIIAEGTLILSQPEIVELLDYAFFIEAPADLRLIRRIQRDIRERGRTLDSILQQYLDTVRPMYEEWVSPSQKCADRVLDGTKTVEELARELTDYLFLDTHK